jgi:diguanylate cyclase (GGDEF)-like protein/PAS domain S-box-containing protein
MPMMTKESSPVPPPFTEDREDLQVLNSLPLAGGVFLATEKGEVEFLNPRFFKIFGMEPEEAGDMSDLSKRVIEEGESGEFSNWWRGLLTSSGGGVIRKRRWRISSKKGGIREVVVSCLCKGGRILVFFLDVTPRRNGLREGKRARRDKEGLLLEIELLKKQLQDQQRYMAGTLDSMVDPYIIVHPTLDDTGKISDFKIDRANEAAESYWNLPKRGAVGRSFRDFIAPQHVSLVMAWCRDVMSTGEALIINDYGYGEELFGEERRFDIRISKVESSLCWTWRDVTCRYRATQKIAESEKRYRLLAQNVSDVVVLTDVNKIVRWVSPSVTEVLGWDFLDWVGRPCTDFLASKAEAAEFDRHRSSVSLNGHAERCRKQILAKDGSVHWVEAHTGPYVDEMGQPDGVVTSFRIIDQQVSMEKELQRIARVDELTKLLNRREGFSRLRKLHGQMHRTGRGVAVLFVDFDDFKAINDDYGHAAGDDVLRAMGERIREILRTNDDVGARIGGDEMLVVLHGVHGLDDARAVSEKLRRSAAEPVLTQGFLVRSTVSVGVVMAEQGEPIEDLVSRADEAMYQAKIKGRNQVVTVETGAKSQDNRKNVEQRKDG